MTCIGCGQPATIQREDFAGKPFAACGGCANKEPWCRGFEEGECARQMFMLRVDPSGGALHRYLAREE